MCEMEKLSICMAALSVHGTSSFVRLLHQVGAVGKNFCLSYNKEGRAEQLLLIYPEQQSSVILYCKESHGTGLTPTCLPAWSGVEDLGIESRGGSSQSRSRSAEGEDLPLCLSRDRGLAGTHHGHASQSRLLK